MIHFGPYSSLCWPELALYEANLSLIRAYLVIFCAVLSLPMLALFEAVARLYSAYVEFMLVYFWLIRRFLELEPMLTYVSPIRNCVKSMLGIR